MSTKIIKKYERKDKDIVSKEELNLEEIISSNFIDRKEIDVYGKIYPSKDYGGNFYDLFLIDDDHLAIVIGDASNKGDIALTFVKDIRNKLKDLFQSGILDPSIVLKELNEYIGKLHNNPIMSIFLAILDLSDGRINIVNAGHEYPFISRNNNDYEILSDIHDLLLSGDNDYSFNSYEMKLNKGDKLFLYTDGLSRAVDEENVLFGRERLLERINQYKELSSEELINKIKDIMDDYIKDETQEDDMTMLMLRYGGRGNMEELNIEATIENIPVVTEFVDKKLEAIDCPIKAQTQIDVAIDELFSNIARYAYHPGVGPATVRVEVEEDPVAVVITFIDNGQPYDPLSREDPDITLGVEEREIGGLGIYLVKKTMDDIQYEYKDGQNILKVKKAI